jgi:hypothetical protein
MTFAQIPAGTAIFVDANSLIYHFANDPAFGVPCTQLVQRIELRQLHGFTSSHVLADVAHRLTHISQMPRPFRHGVCALSQENPAFPTTFPPRRQRTSWVNAKTTPSASVSTAKSSWSFTARPLPATPDSSPIANSIPRSD